MRKKTALLLTVALAVSTLVGCGNGGEAAKEKKIVSTGAEGGLFADEETYTLRMPYVTVGTEPEDLGRITEKVSEITLDKINCDVEFVTVNIADMATKYNMWFSNGEKIDMITTVFMDYVSMINSGAFVSMDGLIDQYGQGLLEKDKEKEFLGAGVYKGEQYGVPTIPAAPGNGGAIVVRKDVYDQLDLAGIDTEGYLDYEDLNTLFAQIKEKCPEYTPFGLSGQVAESNYFYLKNYDDLGVSGGSCGVLMNPTEDTAVTNLFASDEYREYLEWMREWYQAGYISSDAATSSETPNTLMQAGRTASMLSMNSTGQREGLEAQTGVELVQLELCPNYLTTRVYTGVMFFIPENCEKPERAMAFLNLLFTDAKINNLLTHGIEGEHYTLEENGLVAQYTENRDKYTNTIGAWGDQSQSYLLAPQTPDLLKQREEYLAVTMAHQSKAYGYQFDMTEVSVEQSTVKNVLNQYLTQLEYGTVDVDEVYPEFLTALEKAGIQQIIEENQRQLDVWLEKN